jgi:tripartite-type tricarboxylate transporter receptor subunit TctC
MSHSPGEGGLAREDLIVIGHGAIRTPRAIDRQSPPELKRKKVFPSALRYLVGMSARSPEPHPVVPHALVLSPTAGARTIAELIAAAKARGRQITYGSAGTGTSTHFAAEKFRIAAGIDAVHVPYRGGPEVNGDVMAGRVTYWMSPLVMAVPNVREGKLLALGVTSAERSSLLPEVPAIAEAGLPGFNYTTWWGLWAPAGIRTELVEKISKDMTRALLTADLRERLAKFGAEPMTMPPSEFTRYVQSQVQEPKRIAKAAGIKAE